MKAFLLAAGHGTRLKPLTDDLPKCLLPIRGTPMLQIWLETCYRFGIEEVLINVHAHAEKVRKFISEADSRVKVHLVEEKQLLGSAGTLSRNRTWVSSEPFFWVFYGDVLHNVDLSAMLAVHIAKRPVATIGVYRVPDPTRCGIIDLAEDGTVVDFVEKPIHPRTDLAFSGILLATSELLDMIPSKQPVDLGFDVLPRLVGSMLGFHITSYLVDIGTPENYRFAQATWHHVSAVS